MNTKHLLIFLVGSLLLTACNRRENNEPELEQKQDEVKVDDETRKRKEPKTEADLEKYGAEFPFFFGGIIVPDRMEVHQALSMRDLKTMVLLVEIYGEAYAQMSSSTHDKFVTLARQIGDVEQKKGEGYRHIPGTSAETINSGIKNITVKAVTKFNDRYPKGANLNDILLLCYNSYDHIFARPMRAIKSFSYKSYIEGCRDGVKPIRCPRVTTGVWGKYLGWSRGFQYRGGWLLQIGFSEAPNTKWQRFKVTIELEDGKILEDLVEAEITKALDPNARVHQD